MDSQVYRRLLEEIRTLRDEKRALQLNQIGLQRRLNRQESSAQQLRGQLEDQRQVNKQLRDELAKQGTVRNELEKQLDDEKASKEKLQMRLDDQDASNGKLKMELVDQETFNEELQARLKNVTEKMNEAVERAEDITARYEAALEYTRETVNRHNEAVVRTQAERARADLEQQWNEELAEANHRLNLDFMDAQDEAAFMEDAAEAVALQLLQVRAENNRLRATQAGVFRRVRDDIDAMENSDDEDEWMFRLGI
ncbi:hypothetical protein PG993_003805 [Apiospora rasikravindrae]|uniref:Uncharacterized protein n=1 Tax=Apiospora rasikravindrae TaxID=990691 RepID=A0ABR1U0J6_9PEZI